MRRRSWLRTLVASGVIGTGAVTDMSPVPVVQPVTAQSSSGWNEQAKLMADDGETNDFFANTIAMSSNGTTAVIGAKGDGEDAGSAYVFVESDGSWTQKAKLTPTDGDSKDEFGDPIAVSNDGSTAVIGATFDDNANGEDAGSAYVFSGSSGSWSQEAKLTADNGNDNDFFGGTLAVSTDGTTAVVGANRDDDPGSAYVFTESGGSWSQEATFTGEPTDSNAAFGSSISVSSDGTTAVIVAPQENNSNGSGAGAAYVFTESGGSWSQEAKLIATDGDYGDNLGRSLALSSDGNTAILGAPDDEDPNGREAGSAYVFTQSNGSWSQAAKLSATDGASDDFFGIEVAASNDGSTAGIVAPFEDNSNGDSAGSAYMFSESNGTWNQETKLIAADGASSDGFADTRIVSTNDAIVVSGDGTTAVVGAPDDENPNGEAAGSAYVFSNRNGLWSQEAKLIAGDEGFFTSFGSTLAVSDDGTTAIIGASGDEFAYVFNRPPTSDTVEIVNASLDPSDVDEQQSHTLTFDVRNVSADGTGEEYNDEFDVTFPEGVILEDYSNVDIDAQFSTVEQTNNTLTFSVSPRGGGTTQISVRMTVTLSAATN